AAPQAERSLPVVTWLKKVYGNEPIPECEINESTVDFLYNLAECNEARESDAVLQIENMKQKAEEYEAKSEFKRSTSQNTWEQKSSKLTFDTRKWSS
uniref:HAUS augmin-like complex subunit 1 n=1 Tax=Calidris pygmaea TaxID=425635 RepID=A0A8C3PQ90_9CHAR